MRIKMGFLPLVLLVFIGCGGSENAKLPPNNSAISVPVEDEEPTFPERFLIPRIVLSHKVSDSFEIEGHIKNKAASFTYTNIVLEVNYLDNEDKLILRKEYLVDKTVKPGNSVSFFIREKIPDTIGNYKLNVIFARPVKSEV